MRARSRMALVRIWEVVPDRRLFQEAETQEGFAILSFKGMMAFSRCWALQMEILSHLLPSTHHPSLTLAKKKTISSNFCWKTRKMNGNPEMVRQGLVSLRINHPSKEERDCPSLDRLMQGMRIISWIGQKSCSLFQIRLVRCCIMRVFRSLWNGRVREALSSLLVLSATSERSNKKKSTGNPQANTRCS